MRLGPLAYKYFFRPVNGFLSSWKHGGPLALRETARHAREMEAAATTLPILRLPPAPDGYTLHLMTGKRFWYQSAFCIHTFARHAGMAIKIEIYDDGTLEPVHQDALRRLGLPILFHDSASLISRLDHYLPADRFPVLRDRWLLYPNIRKLIDVHLGGSGWKLVIDSDLLFFRRPQLLLDWLSAPQSPLHAVDCAESYGYTRPLMAKLAGAPIPALVNVGLCGLRSETLDWHRLESWCRELIERENAHYFLEQALVAMLVANQQCVIAPADDYVTGPRKPEVETCQAIMHHYVDTSKRWYFRRNWRLTVVE